MCAGRHRIYHRGRRPGPALRDGEDRTRRARHPVRLRQHRDLAKLSEITPEHYDQIFDVNVEGTVFTVQKALPLMSDGGSIILTGEGANGCL